MELWERRRDLGQRVIRQRRLYLDLRFWNDFCDAEVGEPATSATRDCLLALRAFVARGDVVCPIEYHIFSELNKQRRADKREATANIVDELSGKTTLVSPFERVFIEILRFSQALVAGRGCSDPPLGEMWTRPMYLIGHEYPELPRTGLPAEMDQQFQREFADELWNFGFLDMVSLSGSLAVGVDEKATTSDLLNRAKEDSATQLSSYEATYRSEILGSLDGYSEQLEQVGLYLFHRAGGDPSSVPENEIKEAARRLRNLLYAAFLQKDLKDPLPTIHIGATLYSHMQWDRKRKYKSNDIFDFGHAEAALPYCNAFATDRSLASLIRQSGLDRDYDCKLLTDAQAIGRWLDAGTR